MYIYIYIYIYTYIHAWIYNSYITYPVSHIIAEGLPVVSGRHLHSSLIDIMTKMTAPYSIVMAGFQNFPFRSIIRNHLNVTSIKISIKSI